MDFDLVARVTREKVLETFSVDSCIATTRIIIDVLDYFGVQAIPIPVEVTILNEDALTILESDGIEAVAIAVHKEDPKTIGGPWTIGLGLPGFEKKPLEGGHVIAGLPHQNIAIDASLDQASRPIKNIMLEPTVFPVEDEVFFSTPGSTQGIITNEESQRVALLYTHSAFQQFKKSPNWRRQSAVFSASIFKETTGAAIREIRSLAH